MTVIERECPDCEGSGVVYVDDGEGGMDSERCDVCAGDGQVVPASDHHRGAVEALREIASGGHAARFLLNSGRSAQEIANEALDAIGGR